MVTQSLWVGQPAHGNLWAVPIHVYIYIYGNVGSNGYGKCGMEWLTQEWYGCEIQDGQAGKQPSWTCFSL